MRFEGLNWMDIEKYLESDDRLMLVTGACEQHGYLSLLTDIKIPLALADAGLDPQSALDLPRFCIDADSAGGRVAIEEGMPQETYSGLEKMGHHVYSVSGYERALFGRGQVILRDPETGVLCAGSDPGADGCAMTLT